MITWDPERHLQEWYPEVRVVDHEMPPGLLACIDLGQRVVWLAKGLAEGQRRSALAYEVGVLELGPFDRDSGDDGIVDDWASRLFIPFDDHLLDSFQRHSDLSEVAEELRVDVPLLKARLRSLTEAERDLLPATVWHWLDG